MQLLRAKGLLRVSGWRDAHVVRVVLRRLCTAQVHLSLLRLRDETNVGKVITTLTYPWLWMNGCDPVGILKVPGVSLCNQWDRCVWETSSNIQTKNSDWAGLSSPGIRKCFLALSTPELYCSGNLRCEDGAMSYSHNYRHSTSLKSLWRGENHSKSVGMQEMKRLPKSCAEVCARASN